MMRCRLALRLLILAVVSILPAGTNGGQRVPRVAKTPMAASGLALESKTHAGAFFDVVGRRSAIFGYENREWEAWVYPLKVVDDFKLSFRLEGYPLDIDGRSIMTEISIRPEATTLTYAHAAFTVHQIMVAPLDEPGLLVLLEVNSVLPLTITASFRPRLRLMWPATSMTASIGWNAGRHVTQSPKKRNDMPP
jgi:hypothetical protein